MPEPFEGVPINLQAVEATIRAVEQETNWSFPLPGRTAIHQLFISLGMDQGGFAIKMEASTRQNALTLAQEDLDSFLRQLIKKSEEIATGSGYQGKEVGFPVVVHELDVWATTHISCSCWPR